MYKGLDVNLFQFIIPDMQSCTKWKACYLCVMLRFWKNCHYLYLNCKTFCNYILKLYYFKLVISVIMQNSLYTIPLVTLVYVSEWIKNLNLVSISQVLIVISAGNTVISISNHQQLTRKRSGWQGMYCTTFLIKQFVVCRSTIKDSCKKYQLLIILQKTYSFNASLEEF
jgi:hypothetical protein